MNNFRAHLQTPERNFDSQGDGHSLLITHASGRNKMKGIGNNLIYEKRPFTHASGVKKKYFDI